MPHFIYDETLPEPLVEALKSSVFEYSKERNQYLAQFAGQYDEQFSVTDLPRAPKQLWLGRHFYSEVEINLLKDNYHSLLGNVVHAILERHAPSSCIVEERQHVILTVDGVRVLVHGKPDLYNRTKKLLDDYKFTSGYAMLYDKSEYEFQLNANAYLFESRGIPVDKIRNIYMFRFLDPIAMLRNPEYPKENVMAKHYKKWDRSVTEAKIKEFISKHLAHRKTPWRSLPDCTDEERWIRDTSYAVYKRKKGTKTEPIQDWSSKACARFDEKAQAIAFVNSNGNGEIAEELRWEERKGVPKKCMEYCLFTQWCKQYQDELKEREQQQTIGED